MMRSQKTHATAALAYKTSDNTPKQVRSRISKKKRLKNKSTITVDQETNRNLTKPISNQWHRSRQDNNRNHYISQPPVKTVQSSYTNIVSRKKKLLSYLVIVFQKIFE